MLATAGEIPTGPGWTYEVKWDGMRVLARVGADGALRLASRNGGDVTGTFPELACLAELGRDALLDGEVVVLDADGAPSFDLLATRMGITRRDRAAAAAAAAPATYVIFDVVELDGRSLAEEPFRRRRALLEGLALPPGPLVVPATFEVPGALLAATRQRGLEGVVAKRWDAPYRPGVRSRDWIKHSHRDSTDAVVVGWRPGPGGTIASLALAVPTPRGLQYRGTAGSGISAAASGLLTRLLRRAPAPAGCVPHPERDRLGADGFVWADPGTVVEIAHLGLSSGERFRQPVVVRVRPDLPAPDPGSGGASGEARPVTVSVGGRALRISHLDKVLYPATGTTKAQVVQYWATVAPHLLELAAGRPITRRRWPDGVGRPGFFEKNLPAWAPEWIRRATIPAGGKPIGYPVLEQGDTAALIWLAAHAALELHTPQWRVDETGRPLPPDRIVIDLDPGPGAGLDECATVALLVRDLLAEQGLQARAVLSGSKGLHLYAPLPRPGASADELTAAVEALAHRCAAMLPGLVVVTMARRAREGRVLIDYSQNRAAKTTLAPWSLRGTQLPTAACPVDWDEVAAGGLRQLRLDEVLRRLGDGGVPLPW